MPDHAPGPSLNQFSARRRLAVTRTAWLGLTLLTVSVFAAGLPVYYQQLQTVCAAPPCVLSPTPDQVRLLQAAGISLGFWAAGKVGVVALTAAVCAAVAAVIFWRRPADRMAGFTALTLLTFGTFGVADTQVLNAILLAFHPVWRVPVYVLAFVGATGMIVFLFVFPTGHFVPRWLRVPIAGLALWQALINFFPGTWLNLANWPLPGQLLYWGLLFGVCIAAQVYRYRRVSNAGQRQQTKWVVLGIGLALSGALGAFMLTAFGSALVTGWALLGLAQDTSYYPFLMLIPLSIGVAILRSRLYDIDVVINRTLVYSALTALLTLAYFMSVVVLQTASAVLTGSRRNTLVTVLSTLIIAALFVPLRSRVQRAIDRRFFRRKYDAARTLNVFGAYLRNEVDLERLSEHLIGVVQDTMQPTHFSLWLKPPPHPGPAASDRRV